MSDEPQMSELSKKVLEFETRYPLVFRNDGHPPWVNAGWLPMLHTLCNRLERILETAPTDLDPDSYFHVDQIKEKFGGLRFYWSGWCSDEMSELIDQAESDSEKICEGCGQPGRIRNNGSRWIQTLCDSCDT